MEMLGELELIRLIEENEYPARLIEAGVVWVELEITDTKTNAVHRERLSKSAFADLILDWRERRTPNPRELSPALRKIGIAAQPHPVPPTSRAISARAELPTNRHGRKYRAGSRRRQGSGSCCSLAPGSQRSGLVPQVDRGSMRCWAPGPLPRGRPRQP